MKTDTDSTPPTVAQTAAPEAIEAAYEADFDMPIGDDAFSRGYAMGYAAAVWRAAGRPGELKAALESGSFHEAFALAGGPQASTDCTQTPPERSTHDR
jgi:hypothetical protein